MRYTDMIGCDKPTYAIDSCTTRWKMPKPTWTRSITRRQHCLTQKYVAKFFFQCQSTRWKTMFRHKKKNNFQAANVLSVSMLSVNTISLSILVEICFVIFVMEICLHLDMFKHVSKSVELKLHFSIAGYWFRPFDFKCSSSLRLYHFNRIHFDDQ